MVTGSADMPRGTANFQYAKSIVYVAEASTGQVAAYTIPWNSSMQAAGKPQYGEFQPLDVQPIPHRLRPRRTDRQARASEIADDDSGQRRAARDRRRQHASPSCCASWASRSRTWRSKLNLEVVPRAQHARHAAPRRRPPGSRHAGRRRLGMTRRQGDAETRRSDAFVISCLRISFVLHF